MQRSAICFVPGLVLSLSLWAFAACPETTVVDAGGASDASIRDGNSHQDVANTDVLGSDSGSQDLASSDSATPDSFVLACPSDDIYEPNNSAGQAAPLEFPGPVSDTIICDAEDWYTITVPAGFGLALRLDADVNQADLDLFAYSASDASSPIGSSQDRDSREDLFVEYFAEASEVLIQVLNNDAPAEVEYRLVITFYLDGTCASDTAMEPNDSAAEAISLSPPEVNLALEACDAQDWYAVQVPAGNGLSAELRHDPADANLRFALYDPADLTTPLSEQQAYSPIKRLSEVLLVDATARLLLVENLDAPGPRGDYQLSVLLHPGGYCQDDNHEPNDSESMATDLNTGLVAAQLCLDNVDYYRFTLDNPGPGCRVSVSHPGANLDLQLSVQGGAALGSLSQDPSGESSTITFTSQASTTYILRVAKANDETAVGVSYNISALNGSPPANDSCGQAISLTPGTELEGTTIDANDDVSFAAASASCTGSDSDGGDVIYAVHIPAGQVLQAQLTTHQDLLLSLVDGCTTRCCYAGIDAEGADALNDVVETLTWSNNTGLDQDLFLVVDSRGAMLSGDFRLQINLGAGGSNDAGSSTCQADSVADAGSADSAQ